MMSFIESVTTCFQKFVTISGRASRAEYWWYMLFYVLCEIPIVALLAVYIGVKANSSADGGFPIIPVVMIAVKANSSADGVFPIIPVVMVTLLICVILFILGIPLLTATIRRLHDTDRDGMWFFIQFIPYIGSIIFLVFMCLPSTPGENRFGQNPYGEQPDSQTDSLQ